MKATAHKLVVEACQWRRGEPMPGVNSSPLTMHAIGVLTTSRGALIICDGEWVVRIGTDEPFVLRDAEYRAAFCAAAPTKPAEPKAPPRAARELNAADRERVAPARGDTRPTSTVESHRASGAYDPDLEIG